MTSLNKNIHQLDPDGDNGAVQILNAISLNSKRPRNRINELFDNFKKINTSSIVGDINAVLDPHELSLSTSSVSNPITREGVSLSSSKTSLSNSDSTVSHGHDNSIDSIKVTSYSENSAKSQVIPLYVGDLSEDITEEVLFNHFKRYPSLSSVKICYDSRTKKALGYGYVNFKSDSDAKRAIDELNYTKLLNRDIRIMPSLPGKEKSFLGSNVFISNLNTSNGLTLRQFYEKFKTFGGILSCKLNVKKRQGFISFVDPSTADRFVREVNETTIDGLKVYCSHHVPKSKRNSSIYNNKHPHFKNPDFTINGHSDGAKEPSPSFTREKVESNSTKHLELKLAIDIKKPNYQYKDLNKSKTTDGDNIEFTQIYVKGLPLDISKAEIIRLFSSCGKIDEVFTESVPKYVASWALITFESSISANSAIKKFHQFWYQGKRLTCVKALKKSERALQISHNLERSSFLNSTTKVGQPHQNNHSNDFGTTKLYLYNLPKGINENFFKLFLRAYTFEGDILKYQIKSNSPLGHSFIEFEKEIDAKEVHAKLNNVHIGGHRLTASLKKLNDFQDDDQIDNGNVYLDHYIDSSDVLYGNQIQREFPHRVSFPSSFRLPSTIPIASSSISASSPLFQNNNGSLYQLIPISNSEQLSYPKQKRISSYDINSRNGSLRKDLSGNKSQFSSSSYASTIKSLEKVALENIDFLKYPVATRPRYFGRVVQHMIDSYWENDLETLKKLLSSLETDPIVQSRFKEKLVETIELLGFDRWN